MRFWAAVLLCALGAGGYVGCGTDEEGDPSDGPPVTGDTCLTRCPEEPGEAERCEACFENVGRCCFPDDPLMSGHIPGLAFNCQATDGCSACCDECAAMTCDELLANGNCPLEPEPTSEKHLSNSLESGGSALDCMLEAPMTDAGFAANEPLMEALADEGARLMVGYIVSCALPEDQQIEVTLGDETLVFAGGVGLAPEWADGFCDEACQEWVSACLVARINFYPVHVTLNVSGPAADTPLSEPSTEGLLPVDEGAFYGNFFTEPQEIYACRGTGVEPYFRTLRLCTQPGSSCGFSVVGTCGELDGATGLPSERRACESYNEEGGYYERCYDRAADPDGTFPPEARLWTRVVTVHLPRSQFTPGESECYDTGAPPTALPELPAIVGGLGSGCRNDEDCGDPELRCDNVFPGGLCTKVCTDAPTQPEEQAQCAGLGTTCLSGIQAGQSYCTASCETDAAPGEPYACPEHQICTGFWWRRDVVDRSGCMPWCQGDEACAPHRVCEERLGLCAETSFVAPPDARRDGEACSVSARLPNGRSADCLGDCFFLDASDNGLCASFVDLAHTSECPDDPSTMTPLAPSGDNVGICIARTCRQDSECNDPLECGPCPFSDGLCCQYP